jgi:hypothetical protein
MAWYSNVSWDVGGKDLVGWIGFLQELGCTRANLTHHMLDLQELSVLLDTPNMLRWSVHLSSRILGSTDLARYVELVRLVPQLSEILVISGNPRPKRTSFELARDIAAHNIGVPLALAVSAEDSDQRIIEKCSFPNLGRLYMQVAEPEYLNRVLQIIRTHNPKVHISASWLPPTPANWQALRTFPWKGAMFSEQWHQSYDYAVESGQRQLNWMMAQGIELLIEPRRRTAGLLPLLDGYSHTSSTKIE